MEPLRRLGAAVGVGSMMGPKPQDRGLSIHRKSVGLQDERAQVVSTILHLFPSFTWGSITANGRQAGAGVRCKRCFLLFFDIVPTAGGVLFQGTSRHFKAGIWTQLNWTYGKWKSGQHSVTNQSKGIYSNPMLIASLYSIFALKHTQPQVKPRGSSGRKV